MTGTSLSRRYLPAILFLTTCSAAQAAVPLGQYDVDPSTVTVAGISSGGFMAVQMQVAFSSHFHGAAVFAGGPFYCAEGSESTATGACESGSGIALADLVTYTEVEADAGAIDDPSNLAGQPIYLFSGTQDTTVHQATMNALQQYYQTWISSSDITYNNSTAAEHGWISPDGPNACASSYEPYINNCSIDPEQTFLTQFYGSLNAKNTGNLGGSFVQFDQTAFCGGGGCSSISMDSTGWAYVPASCAGGATCKLVLALHGCLQYQGVVGQDFVKDSGLNEWADTNGIIVLYPQTTSSGGNPEGCWDWWGYSSPSYSLQSGPQMQALIGMVNQVGAAYPNGQVTTSSSTASSSSTSGSTGSSGVVTTGSSSGASGACVGLGLSCASNSNCCQGLGAGLVVTCQTANQLCLPSLGSTATTTVTTASSGSSGLSGSTSQAPASSGSSGPGTTSTSGASTSGGAAGSGSAATSSAATSSATTGSAGTSSGASGSTTGGGAFSISSVSPTSAVSGTSASLVIEGTGFASGDQATVGSELVTAVSVQSPSVLTGTLPLGLAAGVYDVTVIAPSGQKAVLPQSFTVTAKSGCASTDGMALGSLVAVAGVLRPRRRRGTRRS